MREGKVKAAIRGEAAVAIVRLPTATHQDAVVVESAQAVGAAPVLPITTYVGSEV